jgi:fimbrial chaperone protein
MALAPLPFEAAGPRARRWWPGGNSGINVAFMKEVLRAQADADSSLFTRAPPLSKHQQQPFPIAFFSPLPDNISREATLHKSTFASALTLALLLGLFSFSAHAFRLDPMVINVALQGPRASATYTVENNTKARIAVEFSVRHRVIDENGKEERPAAEGFLVYPEQMSLEPGQKRAVRVTWQAEKMPEAELPFRFVASQLPVEFSEDAPKEARKVNLKFLIEYVASLYLNPPRTKAKMKVLKSQAKEGKLEVLVANEGNSHFLLERLELSARAGGKSFKASSEQLKDIRTENLLPGGTRWLKIPLPAGFPASGLSVDVDFGQ